TPDSPDCATVRMPSEMRSAEIVEMVELLRPVTAAISVRDGWLARRTEAITIARFFRRRSSCRTPTVIPISSMYWTRAGLAFLIPKGQSGREDIDMTQMLSHSFFRSSKKKSFVLVPNGPIGRNIMKRFATALLAGAALSLTMAASALAEGKTIGVSWSNFQEERWKTDEAAIKAALEAAGNKYISADAQSSAAKQLTDVEALIAQGADALIILAQDASAIGPAVEKAVAEGIPVVGYDRLIENPDAFYLTFDNKEVGRLQAKAVFDVKP